MPDALIFDRVRETTATTGTGTVTLAGAVAGFRAFSTVGNGSTCYYLIEDGVNWEVGTGVYTLSGTTLSRAAVLASSNAGALVDFGVGTKQVYLTAPAEVFRGTDGQIPIGQTASGMLVKKSVTGVIRIDKDGVTTFLPNLTGGGSLLFTMTATPAAITATTETDFAPTGTGTLTVPAASVSIGDKFVVTMAGFYSGTVLPTIRGKGYFGSTVVADTTAISGLVTGTNLPWRAEITCTVRTTGATGTLQVEGWLTFSTAATAALLVQIKSTQYTIDFTAANLVKFSVQWGAGGTGQTITLDDLALNKHTAQAAAGTVTSVSGESGVISVANPTSTPALSIPANGLANAKLAQMAAYTLKGNQTGAPANAADLTIAEILSMVGAAPPNYLVNGGMQFAQRKVKPYSDIGLTATTFPGPNVQDPYWFDRFRMNNQTGLSGWEQRLLTLGSGTGVGFKSDTVAGFSQATRADKLLLYQPVESFLCAPLSARQAQVTFQCKFYQVGGTGLANVNIGVLKWAGTSNVLPATGVMSAWSSSAASDPTLATSYTMLGKVTTPVVTTTMHALSTTITLPTGCNNLCPILWFDDPCAINDGFYTSDWSLTPGPGVPPWLPRQGELELAQRYHKGLWYSGAYDLVTFGEAGTTTNFRGPLYYQRMRVAPAITFSAASTFLAQTLNANKAVSAITASDIGTDSAMVDVTCATMVAGHGGLIFDNGVVATILLDADL